MAVGEGGNNFSGCPGDSHPFKGISGDYPFGDQPGEKDAEAAQVAVDGVPGDFLILSMIETMTGKTRLLLQVENERPDFISANLGDTGAYPM